MEKRKLLNIELAEIERFSLEMQKLDRGDISDIEFTRFRLGNGIYGLRDRDKEHMVRIKIPYGCLNSDQLEMIANITDRHTPNKLGHITTRQDIQIHYVSRKDVPEIMRLLNECGLTTREACGNTVRNITACHISGISPIEVFDVSYYADVLFRFLLRNPLCQCMPRKFKIAFEGCPEDHARVTIHDLGFVAKTRGASGKKERGFQVYVGGGLGSMPKSAFLLEEFTPLSIVVPTAEAVIRIHDRYSDRVDRNRARIKYFIKKIGEQEAKKLILNERSAVLATLSGKTMLASEEMAREPEELGAPHIDALEQTVSLSEDEKKGYVAWLGTNVFEQKQKGFFAVTVRCPLGDINSKQMRKVADLAREYCGERIRTTITQNLIMSWVPEQALAWIYKGLCVVDLAYDCADRIIDVTRCPGADTCRIAITHSKGLARQLMLVLDNDLGSKEAQDIKIKVSGCFNSCGQHHIADIGFYGLGKRLNGRDVPHYQLLLGGATKEGLSTFGKPVFLLPAKNVPQALSRLFHFYLEERQKNERFHAFVNRMGIAKFKEILKEFTTVPLPEDEPSYYEDWDAEGVPFKISVGTGECAV